MADLFGDWVPDEWIEEVFAACKKAPQHRYLFLTKNPQRYIVLASVGLLPDGDNFWYGSSTPSRDDPGFCTHKYNTFLSVEPILSEFERKPEGVPSGFADWVVLGAMTGPGSRNHVPKLETIENIIASVDVPVFMKDTVEGSSPEFPYTKHTVSVRGVPEPSRSQEAKLAELRAKRQEIEAWVDALPTERERALVELRAFQKLPWTKIFRQSGHPSPDAARVDYDRIVKKYL